MLCIDFTSYIIHRFMHSQPWLWHVHSVHHSAKVLTPLTTYRQHPLEPLILNVCRAGAAGLGLVFFRAFFPNETPVFTLYGLGAGFFVYMFTVNLHHSMIPVSYPKVLRRIFVSPHLHHLHHSKNEKHFNCNYGVVFSVWDQIFGTYQDQEFGLGELHFGLASANVLVDHQPPDLPAASSFF
jgi:sterol desaturase/sphingolipid hydroxylase (fatty acid hydroxylase superfamily)